MKLRTVYFALLGAFFSFSAMAKSIAITLDDLPFVGTARNARQFEERNNYFMQIVNLLKENHIPAAGFVIPGSVQKGQWQWVEAFKEAGFIVGNHTDHHLNLNRITAARYKDDVLKADQALQPYMTQPFYFRYPFLATGNTPAK